MNNYEEDIEIDHKELQNFFFQHMDEDYYGVTSFDDLKEIMEIQAKFAKERLAMNTAFDQLVKYRKDADNADDADKPVSVVEKEKVDDVQEIPSVLNAHDLIVHEQKKHRDAITSIMPVIRRKKHHAIIGRKAKALAKAKK